MADAEEPDVARTAPGPERSIDRVLHRLLARTPADGVPGALVEFLAFGLKQAWACLFGVLLLLVLGAARLWYPEHAALARNDLITLAAIAIQVMMLVTRLETLGELRAILLFHVVGTLMELFKTDIGSWSYEPGGVLRIAAVPLFSGFMYAAVGSYMVRVVRLFDLRFTRWPRGWATVAVAVLIYVNFYSHHWIWDLRWPIVGLVVLVWARSMQSARVFRRTLRMPVTLAFLLVAVFIWLAENVATWAHAWTYPFQANGWQPVGMTKLVAWFLLMIVSVVLVTWVAPPHPPDANADGVPAPRTAGALSSPAEGFSGTAASHPGRARGRRPARDPTP